jgi:hypothetical protein
MAEWISVNDRLPEDDGEYLVFWSLSIRGRSYRGVTCKQFDDCIGFYDEVEEVGDIYRRESNDIVTHWMPLPEPPEEE